MNQIFHNMLPFEVILLAMGIIIFLALIFLLIWNVLKQRNIAALLPFYLLPVIMVGYPSIRVIRFDKGVWEIDKYSKAVYQNPADTAASRHLEEAVAQLKGNKRVIQNPNALASIANAQIALGQYDSASLYLNKVEKLNPDSREVESLKGKLRDKVTLQNNFSRGIMTLNKQIGQLKQSRDTQSLNRIAHTLSALKIPPYIQPDEMITLAKSYAIVGDKKQSLEIVNTVSRTKPSEQVQMEFLKDSIRKDLYQKNYLKPNVQPGMIAQPKVIDKNVLDKVVIRKK